MLFRHEFVMDLDLILDGLGAGLGGQLGPNIGPRTLSKSSKTRIESRRKAILMYVLVLGRFVIVFKTQLGIFASLLNDFAINVFTNSLTSFPQHAMH